MMKETIYETPEMEMFYFLEDDVITSSFVEDEVTVPDLDDGADED